MGSDNLIRNKVLVLGGLIIDKYLLVGEYPAKGEDVLINESFERVGGSTINVACTLKNLGITAYPVSTVGDDPDGQVIEAYLQAANIPRDCARVQAGQRTGYSLVIVDAASERTFMTFKGCESKFSTALIAAPLMASTAFVYLTGYYLLAENAGEIVDFVREIKARGAAVMFDPGPLVQAINGSILLAVLGLSDILVPNTTEINRLRERLAITGDFIEWATAQGISYVIIKNGSKGVTAYTGRKRYELPAFAVKAVDTTGAGDCFAAGCIYGFLQGLAIEEILKIGSACGALNTTFIGPNGNFGLDDIKKLIKGD
ncbi:carbohydrate kinase family protein [Sporomusa termitida]|uniref:Acarbose 7(IV)-phosphotransferase n=1 Tax=Sporomusa termitida TaxID=2377 RepID=A0A517DUX1_9FIRM|nr:carbohydrate kinase family protein [Sporomusa termitida]QDR81154.1 Acarbose 7(IV)-phosphotransferase [Sporomusa termitida]